MCRSIFLTSAQAGGEWSASRPCRFTPGEGSPCTHWIGGWVNPRAGLDYVENRKFLTLPGLELHLSVVQPVTSRYTNCAILTPKLWVEERIILDVHRSEVQGKCWRAWN
jgi:hypothetical protein